MAFVTGVGFNLTFMDKCGIMKGWCDFGQRRRCMMVRNDTSKIREELQEIQDEYEKGGSIDSLMKAKNKLAQLIGQLDILWMAATETEIMNEIFNLLEAMVMATKSPFNPLLASQVL